MTEEEARLEEAAIAAASQGAADGTSAEHGESLEGEEPETEIRDTDIVFDCPHCGHNLAIDYRGAGLQITCVNCGESVLVPIPDGMKIDDLDIEPGEILKQLFAARRHIQKAERRVEQLEDELHKMTIRRDTLQAMLEFSKVQIGEMQAFCRKQADLQEKMSTMLDRMAHDLDADMADEAAFANDDGREDGAVST